jgi:hypothetical protein
VARGDAVRRRTEGAERGTRQPRPSSDQQPAAPLSRTNLLDDIAKSTAIVEACATVLDSMPVY